MPTLEMESLPCDCCGGSNEHFVLNKAGMLTGEMFRLVQCRDCGFLYINPRPTERAIISLYDGAYYDGEGFDANAAYTSPKDVIEKKYFAQRCLRFRRPPARLLDYGCGIGGLIKSTRALGFDSEGYEPSPDGRAKGLADGLTVYATPQDIPAGSYDIVVAMEVLEHAHRPSEMFSHIYRALKPGGVFVYTTWNPTTWLVLHRFKLSHDHGYILPEGHLNFFGGKVMRRYLRETGFSGFGPPFHSPTGTKTEIARHLVKSLLGLHLPSAIK